MTRLSSSDGVVTVETQGDRGDYAMQMKLRITIPNPQLSSDEEEPMTEEGNSKLFVTG